MAWLTWILLESPVALGAAAFAILFVLLVYWRKSGRPLPLLIGVAAVIAAFVTQALVETRRELSGRLLERVEQQAVEGRIDELQRLLSPNFSAGDLDAENFLELAQQRLKDHPLTNVQRLGSEVLQSESDKFTVRNSYYVTGRFGDLGGGAFQCTVQFEFKRQGDDWRIAAIHPPRIQGLQFESWTQVVAR